MEWLDFSNGFMTALKETPYAIDILFWLIVCVIAAVVTMKLPLGLAGVLGFFVAAIGAFLVMFHMAYVNQSSAGPNSVSNLTVEQVVKNLRYQSEACGRNSALCPALGDVEAQAIETLKGKKKSAYSEAVFTLLTNFTLMTLGGMSASFISSTLLRRARPGEDEAEEAAMRRKSRPFMLVLTLLTVVLSLLALCSTLALFFIKDLVWTQSSSAVVSAFAYALILSLMSWVATCFGYVDKPKGRYFFILVILLVVPAVLFYGVGVSTFIDVRGWQDGWISLLFWGVPLIYVFWHAALLVERRKAESV